MNFFQDMAFNPFLKTGLWAGLFASLACGVIGPYVITRRIVFLGGAIAHVAVGGIGASIYLAYTFPETLGWFKPMHGAVIVSLISAVIIGIVHEKVSVRMDTLIGAMWAVGMATGLMLLKFTPGYHSELMSYLFGSIAFVEYSDLMLMAILNVIIIVTVLIFHKRLLAICLDAQFAELQGIGVLGTNILLLTLVALTIICLIKVVGLILVLALLTLPAATASHMVSRMGPLIYVSILLCTACTTIPRVAVYNTRISPEAAIVLTAAGLYLLTVSVTRLYAHWKLSVKAKGGRVMAEV